METCGFPEIRGPFLRVHLLKIMPFWGLYLGSLTSGLLFRKTTPHTYDRTCTPMIIITFESFGLRLG